MSEDPRLAPLMSRHEELRRRGHSVTVEQLCSDCPEMVAVLRAHLAAAQPLAAVPGTIELSAAASAAPVTAADDLSAPASPSATGLVAATLNEPPSGLSRPPDTLEGAGPDHPSLVLDSPLRRALPALPGYQILGELGRGGMGVVYKARHLALNRLVAIKMVLSGAHAGPTELARFHIEAEAVASLQHPNIVQVFGVGEQDDCPFLVLEYVDGGGLDRLLGGKPHQPRESAALVEILARAMHAAHQRGIIHRDLKPANILLARTGHNRPGDASQTACPLTPGLADLTDPGGECWTPKISDFGLAKRVEGDSHTPSGSVLGTPGYMAPEQALGKVRDVGPHSDTYALGAILYELLTGRPPFRAASVVETLRLVTTTEPKPPAQVRGSPLPRDLETICLKGLHKDVKKRYATAGELADELRRFLNGEPILARPVGRLERTVKWVRRRPAAAALVAVSLAAVLSLLGGGLWYNGKLRAALDRSQQRLRIARSAVDDSYTQVAEKWLSDEPQMDALQQQFLEKALKLYEELAEEEGGDSSLRRETGQAQFRVAQIYRQLNRLAESEKAFDRAIAIQGDLLKKSPESRQYRQDLANSCNWLGELFRDKLGRLDDALAFYEKALVLQRALVDEVAGEPVYQQELARSFYNRALALGSKGKHEEARRDLERAIALLKKAGARQELARVRLNLGKVLRALNRPAGALQAYGAALADLDRLLKGQPGKPDYRYEQAVAYNNLSNLQGESLHDPWLAEKSNRKARDILEVLVKEFPSRPTYGKELATVWNSLGAIRFRQGVRWEALGAVLGLPASSSSLHCAGQCREGAMDAWREAHDRFKALARQWSGVADYHHGAGQASYNRGWLALRNGQAAVARGYLLDGIQHEQEALRISPQGKDYRLELGKQNRTLARCLLRLGDHAGAAAAAARSAPP